MLGTEPYQLDTVTQSLLIGLLPSVGIMEHSIKTPYQEFLCYNDNMECI